MLFNSLSFLIYFPIVTIGYFNLPHNLRWLWLLGASCVFYMYFVPIYIVILFFTIVVDYIAGILIERNTGGRRRLFLIASIIANVGVLAVFKYYNFINANVRAIASAFAVPYGIPDLAMVLPIGLSFHTFQAMSYTIEVFRGRQKAERHFGIYSLYVMFYPQLVAGPIERPQNLLPQFWDRHEFSYRNATTGLKLMAWGFFMKSVIADRLAPVVNRVYENPSGFSGPAVAIAAVFFSYQIYCDFAGYSCIALGAARVMGFRLMRNFDRPYQASDIADFWRRWHISLSTWFKDYLYVPLGGSRTTAARRYMNIMIVFLVSGLWHGANWTYVLWGALHGFAMLLADATRSLRSRALQTVGPSIDLRVRQIFGCLALFAFVTFAWIFFRAPSIGSAFAVISRLGEGWSQLSGLAALQRTIEPLGMSPRGLIGCFGLIALLEVVQFAHSKVNLQTAISAQPVLIRWALYYGLVTLIVTQGVFGRQQFIYFQF